MIGKITNIQRFSVTDGPGIRTIVFMLGCSLRCKWCQNPETLSTEVDVMYIENVCVGCGVCSKVCSCPKVENGLYPIDREKCTKCFRCTEVCPYNAKKKSGFLMDVDEVVAEVLKDEIFYRESNGGLTLSGGEALLQDEFCLQLCKKIKGKNISTCVETAGHVPLKKLEKLEEYIDLFLYDFKLLDEEKHKHWTGGSNKTILSNLNYLISKNKSIIIRIPLIPEVNDGEEFENIINYLKSINFNGEIHILPFHQMGSSKYEQLDVCYEMQSWNENNKEEVNRCQSYAIDKGFLCSVGGY